MDTLEALYTRYSCRQYSDREVSKENIDKILKAALAAPSAVNSRNWSFIVVREKSTLLKMAEANGQAANALKSANFAVLIVSDMNLTYERFPDYWIIDGAIAGENMCIAATGLGIQSLWLGTWPQEIKMANQRAIFNLPDNIIPHSVIAFGYAEDESKVGLENKGLRANDNKIHWEKW